MIELIGGSIIIGAGVLLALVVLLGLLIIALSVPKLTLSIIGVLMLFGGNPLGILPLIIVVGLLLKGGGSTPSSSSSGPRSRLR